MWTLAASSSTVPMMNCITLLWKLPLQQTWRSATITHFLNVSMCPPLRPLTFSLRPSVSMSAGVALATASDRLERSTTIRFDEEVSFSSDPLEQQQLKVRISVSPKGTKNTWELVLENLRRSAPPVRGFRKGKGGKSIIPRDVLYQMLGPSRVDRFVIDEIISSAVLEFVEKQGIKVKKDFKIEQTSAELAESFKPGKEFGCVVILELEESSEEGSQD